MVKTTIDVIIGKSLSGKSYAVREILSRCNDRSIVQKLITRTTRPMRTEDQSDQTYHFWNNRQYIITLEKSPEDIIAPREYQVQFDHEQATWRYFINRQNLLAVDPSVKHLLLIIDWQGYLDLIAVINNDPELSEKFDLRGYYINAPLRTRLSRMVSSSRADDDPAEMLRRVYYDEFIDFKSLDEHVTTSRQQLLKQYRVSVYDSSQELITDYTAML